MASPAVTYSFSNGTVADASQVNQNFTDIINGITDGTKDLSISALTVAGNFTATGTTNTIGNATSDDFVVTASLASTINIKTTATYNIGSSTLGLAGIYFGANSQTVRIVGSGSMSATWTLTLPTTAGTANYALVTNGSGVSSWQAWSDSSWAATSTTAGTVPSYEVASGSLDGNFTGGTYRAVRVGKLVTVTLVNPNWASASIIVSTVTLPSSMRPDNENKTYSYTSGTTTKAVRVDADGTMRVHSHDPSDLTQFLASTGNTGNNLSISYAIA